MRVRIRVRVRVGVNNRVRVGVRVRVRVGLGSVRGRTDGEREQALLRHHVAAAEAPQPRRRGRPGEQLLRDRRDGRERARRQYDRLRLRDHLPGIVLVETGPRG